MRPNPESELEQFIDQELRQLPQRRAPADLLPRVMQAIAERERRPWWQRSAVSWPWPARLVFLLGTSGLAAVLVYFTWGFGLGVPMGALADEVAELGARCDTLLNVSRSLGGALVAVARLGGSWLVWVAAGVVGASYCTTLALGTYCYRLVAQRA